MNNRTPTPSVPIVLDRPRALRFTAAAFARLEEAYDRPIGELLAELQAGAKAGKMRMRLVLELLTAGLQHEDPDLTWQSLGDAIGVADIPSLIGPLTKAIRLAFPAPKEEPDPNPAPAEMPASV